MTATSRIQEPIITTDMSQLGTAGVQVEMTAEQAEEYGVVEETALSEADAWDSQVDLAGADTQGSTRG